MQPPPSSDDWRQLEPLVDALLDATPDQRPALLEALSGGDASRRSELERIAAECERAFPLLDQPVADRFAALFLDEAPPVPEIIAGRYRVLREAGRGGTAIVYLARDLKHGRDVAVKVVRPELAASLGRVRFLREIEIAARLRHPHIVPLYDSGEFPAAHADGNDGDALTTLLYYVMPYEDGLSLRERLSSDGPLPVEDTVLILRDICEALAHAHRHGIVHRDIKPDNILLCARHAMVTDFGVARAVSEAAANATRAVSGMVVGTPAYMAPEQAASDSRVDQRADIYAVGVLAYELLEGRPPFTDFRHHALAASVASVASLTSGAVASPDLATPPARLPSHVPQALAELIMKCLATRPEDRWQSADELLERLAAIPLSSPAQRGQSRLTAARVATLSAIALAVALLIAYAASQARDRGANASLALGPARLLTSAPGLEVQPTTSPDGRLVAYAAGNSVRTRIAIRAVAGGGAKWLTTDTAASEWYPRWSPDGARILFLSRGGVFSAPASGGPSREEIPNAPGAIVSSATWSADGREIAYVRGDSLLARNLGSGAVRLIGIGTDLHSCSWSPDGARLACVSGNSFYSTVGAISGIGPMFGNLAPSRIVIIPAAGGAPVSVTDSAALHQSPAWSRDGRTLYYVSNRHGTRDIYALDVGERNTADGEPVRITTGLGAHSIDFPVSGGRIVYAVYRSSANVWTLPIPSHPPASLASAVPVTTGNQTVEGVRVSPDGRWVVYDSDLSGNSDVYRVPITGGEAERLTSGPADEFRGVISPDGRELAYHSFETGFRNLFLLPLGGGPVKQVTRSPGQRSMPNWSPDGTALALFDIDRAEVLVMRRDQRGSWGTPRLVARPGWRPEWSPDGRTIAFISPSNGGIGLVPADSGRQRDIYVPRNGDPLAELAIFAASGRELYFKSHDALGRALLWSIPVAGGRPRLLVRFDDPARPSNRFEFASDGTRFYFTVEDRQSDIWVGQVGGTTGSGL